MKRISVVMLTGLLLVAIGALVAEQKQHHSPYAGEQKRNIKSLSANDIEQLTAGAGWGLAKAAELNGVPGPMHLLEMRNEINLTDAQIQRIEAVFQKMRTSAKALGAQLIEEELMLEQRFRDELPDEAELRSLLDRIGETRTSLRHVHLSAHLLMPEILKEEQIRQYNQLRGYADNNDPCINVPQGHNEKMWKMHNGCN